MSSSFADRALIGASAALALVAVGTRLHDVAAFPAMHDWDAGGHALNVVDLMEGHWPDPRSWCGSHPPVFYALSALLAWLLPASIPIHVTMRALSAGAWIATVALVWRSLRRLGDPVDAAVVGAVLLGVPGLTIASIMMTNDALCALFTTATLVRLVATPRDTFPSLRSVALTGVLAGLAATTKATGVAALGMAAAFYAWQTRRDLGRGLRMLAVLALASALIAGPHYARLFTSISGSAYDILAVRAGSQEKEVIATTVHAIARATNRFSFPTLVHTALWGDPTAIYLPRELESRWPLRAVSIGGAIVTALALLGAAHFVVRRRAFAAITVALVFGTAFAAALAPHAVDRPYIVLTKTNYLLPEALPLGILLALGLAWIPLRERTHLRVVLLAIAAGGIGITTYGWWDATPAPAPQAATPASTNPAARAVERYFADRARDPIRALRALAPEVQLAHELRLVRILGLPLLPPEPDQTPDGIRSLELARARVAWLELYNLVPWYQPITTALAVEALDVRERDDDAEVRVRLAAREPSAPAGVTIGLWPFPPFEHHLTLARQDGAWRITRIDPVGVVDENALQAFVAQPTMAGFDHLRALGWHPPWENAVASIHAGR